MASSLILQVRGIESAKHKIVRAAIHLLEIDGYLREALGKTDAYEIIKDANGEEKVNFRIGPPRDVLVIVGEVVYQLRSALNHLAFNLVESNPTKISLPKNWDRACQFPLMLDVPTHGNPPVQYPLPVPKKVFEDKLPGISDAAYAFIEAVQPYHTGPGIHNVLRIVGELSNIDKHRHLHVILPRVAVHQEIVYSNGMIGVSTVGGLQHGAKIPIPDDIPFNAGKYIKRSFTPYVTFNETIGSGPDTLEAQNVLQVCVEQIETVIIPTFERFLQHP